jgi:hypothetical protein
VPKANPLLAGLALIVSALPTCVLADFSQQEQAIFANELPHVRVLLERALSFERDRDEHEGEWQAAILYCDASRLGSAEGQFRLGMLYAFGKGVPGDRALAASLFSIAASQGHFEAQKMLETIEMTTSRLPPCATEAVLPERAPPPTLALEPHSGASVPRIDRYLENLPHKKKWVVDLVYTLAGWYQIDPRLALSVISVESNFETGAQSPKAAMGLMQLIPGTAERFNVRNAYDAAQNIRGGLKYLRWLLSYFRGDVALALAGYNAGERAVDRYRGVPPYPETQNYVKRVLYLYERTTHPFDENITQPSPVLIHRG